MSVAASAHASSAGAGSRRARAVPASSDERLGHAAGECAAPDAPVFEAPRFTG
jgi:hypothetical protein